ncbi:MAG: thioredoxin family protein [Solobacterium sp.]|nr:thioredoxin family protein [Solobacterium sp.]
MKKVLLFLICLLMAAGCAAPNEVELKTTEADMTPFIWIRGETADFRQTTWTEVIRLFTEKGTGVVYYGYKDCAYCQRAVPELNEAAKENGAVIYYVDVHGEEQPDEEQFNQLMELIDKTLDHDENGEPLFYVPYVIGIRNGKIQGSHTSLVDGFKPQDASDQLSDEQRARLRGIFSDIISKTFR